MPVEILEIIVRANIQEAGSAPAVTPDRGNSGEANNFNRQQLIEAAAEQLLEVLRRKEER